MRFDNIQFIRFCRLVTAASAILVVGGGLPGCGKDSAPSLSIASKPSTAPATPAAGHAPTAPVNPADIDPAVTNSKGQPKETWEAVYAYGTKIGWGHITQRDIDEGGKKYVQIDAVNHLNVNREGQKTSIEISTQSVETREGELLRFHTTMNTGPSRTEMVGRVEDNELVVQTTTQGKTTTDNLPWNPGTLGFHAVEQSLAKSPMLPGQCRTLKALGVATNTLVTIELLAEQYEPTPLVGHTQDLLRINCNITLPVAVMEDKPSVIRSQLWTDREGQVWKTSVAAMHQETFRTTKELALAEGGPRRLDLVIDNTVRTTGRELTSPHATRRVRYRVRLDHDDPAKVFFDGRLQEVVPLDPHTADITVRRFVRETKTADGASASAAAAGASPGESSSVNAAATSPKVRRPPTDDDRAANNFIQSDDPKIVALANSVAADETDSWKLAMELEKLVKTTIRLKTFSQAFSTAAEVAEIREGDCTEHAVLLAALARARGIPARVVIGLMYVPSAQSFGYHMWNELWIDDRWLPLDGTLGKGGIGAGHLKLTDSSLTGATAYSSFLPVAQVIGQLKIEILEAE